MVIKFGGVVAILWVKFKKISEEVIVKKLNWVFKLSRPRVVLVKYKEIWSKFKRNVWNI